MYLMVENPGVCPIEGFTVLGVSTAREQASKIGQFGSGNKHAVNVLLRHGLNPVIFLGTKRLAFFSEPAMMGDKEYHRVYFKLSNRKPEPTGFSLEFGAIDWVGVDMALREIVSNAIDQSDGNIENVSVKIVSNIAAKKDHTRVFIPLTPDVQKFVNELNRWFLHWTGQEERDLLPKTEKSPARIYRKGVFVRELPSRDGDSLFDYNFGDALTIDECRNLSDYSARIHVGRVLSRHENGIVALLNAMKNGETVWEAGLGEFELTYSADKDVWEKAWKSTYGDAVISDNDVVSEMVRRKGFRVIESSSVFCQTLVKNGIRAAVSHIGEVEATGNDVIDPTPDAIRTLDTVWDWLEVLDLTNGKEKPPVKCFSKIMDGGTVLCGYYQDGVVYLNVDNDTSLQTMLEEVAHYITGSTDNSRDFQDFAFNVAARMMKA